MATKRNLGLVSGLEYANLDFVRRFVRAIPAERYTLILTAVCVPCRVAEQEAQRVGLDHHWFKWRCSPWLIVPKCSALTLLYDGSNFTPLSKLATFARRYNPETDMCVFGPDGPIQNGVDFLLGKDATVTMARRGYGDYSDPRSYRTQ